MEFWKGLLEKANWNKAVNMEAEKMCAENASTLSGTIGKRIQEAVIKGDERGEEQIAKDILQSEDVKGAYDRGRAALKNTVDGKANIREQAKVLGDKGSNIRTAKGVGSSMLNYYGLKDVTDRSSKNLAATMATRYGLSAAAIGAPLAIANTITGRNKDHYGLGDDIAVGGITAGVSAGIGAAIGAIAKK